MKQFCVALLDTVLTALAVAFLLVLQRPGFREFFKLWWEKTRDGAKDIWKLYRAKRDFVRIIKIHTHRPRIITKD